MRVEGHVTLGVSRADAWRGVNDPEILKAFEQLLDDGAIALDSSPDS